MHLAEFAVRRYQFTIAVFLALVVLGVVAFVEIPRAEDPIFPNPQFGIIAVYPGASPHDIERLVVEPIEDEVNAIEDITSLKSTIEDGLAVIQVDFDAKVDVDRKHDELLRVTNALRPDLPATLRSLEVRRAGTDSVALAQIAIYSDDASYRDLEDRADTLKKKLAAIPGVKTVETWGFPERQLQVILDPAKLEQLHVPLDLVLAALANANLLIPGGTVDIGRRNFAVRTSGSFESIDEVENTVLVSRGADLLHLRNVAKVVPGYEDERYVNRYNGHRAVFVTVQQKADQNVFTLTDGIKNAVEQFRPSLPSSMSVDIGFDQSRNVAHRLGGLSRDFIIAILLVLVTLLPLGLRPAFIVMISIPLSLAIGIALLFASGNSINQLSIVGFVIALGLLVDDSIVATENVTRFVRGGKSRDRAAIAGTKQIAVAIAGCTATLIIAFLPLLFLPGSPGRYIRSMPLAVVFTVSASLAVSLTIVPFLASRILKDSTEETRAYKAMHRFIEGSYKRLLEQALARPAFVVAVSTALFCLSLMLIPVIGFSLFPKAGIPQFRITIETPNGSSIEETDRAVRFVEQTLAKHSDISSVMANIGGGNPQIYYNVVRKEEKSNLGEVIATLSTHDGKEITRRLDALRDELGAYPSAKLELKEFENGPYVEAPIAIRVLGDDLGELKRMAGEIEGIISSTAGTMYVGNPVSIGKTDLRIRIDRDRAGIVHVQEANIERAVRMAISGIAVSRFRESNHKESDIVVTLPRNTRQTIKSLEGMTVSADTGAQVPLSQVATLDLETSPSTIEHYGKQRSITLTAYVRNGFLTDRVTNDITAKLGAIDWPKGMSYIAAGEIEMRKQSFDGLGTAILIAACGTLVVLVLEFGTFKYMLIVASIIPMGITGGLLALLISGYSISFTAFVGFVALVGVDMKNSILLVDYTNRLRSRGMPLDKAIRQAGETRFFPVLLTTCTALGGLTPLVLEHSSLYSPLALVLMGGLISSTLLARVIEPVMYKLLATESPVVALDELRTTGS